MARLSQILPKEIRKVLIRQGFEERPGKGSHLVFVHLDGRRTVLAIHSKPVSKGTLRAILRQTGLTIDEIKN